MTQNTIEQLLLPPLEIPGPPREQSRDPYSSPDVISLTTVRPPAPPAQFNSVSAPAPPTPANQFYTAPQQSGTILSPSLSSYSTFNGGGVNAPANTNNPPAPPSKFYSSPTIIAATTFNAPVAPNNVLPPSPPLTTYSYPVSQQSAANKFSPPIVSSQQSSFLTQSESSFQPSPPGQPGSFRPVAAGQPASESYSAPLAPPVFKPTPQVNSGYTVPQAPQQAPDDSYSAPQAPVLDNRPSYKPPQSNSKPTLV